MSDNPTEEKCKVKDIKVMLDKSTYDTESMEKRFNIKTCSRCAFSAVSVVKGHEALTCHRYAPHPLVGGSGTGWSDYEWPVVATTEFCGEWECGDD